MSIGAYIHIPFCTHKCDFCDFAAFAGLDHLEDQYCAVVKSEIESRLANCSGSDTAPAELHSVFYGGGTPGLIATRNLESIHQCLTGFLPPSRHHETTLETTPHAITDDKARDWLSIGINRLSIGVESFHDDELNAMGRDHSRSQATAGIETALSQGFQNISIDFMYGLPTQTLSSWEETLNQLFEYSDKNPQISHFSAYGLQLSQQSPLYFRFPKDSSEYPDEELFEKMYFLMVELAESKGFEQYEVSNFAKPGYQSQHNLTYWNNAPYLGFGVSAHRYIDGARSSNWRSLNRYLKDCLGDETMEVIDPTTRTKEAIMLGLRKRAGINLSDFAREHGFDLQEKFKKQLEKLAAGEFIEIVDGHLRITQKGVPVSNSIISELF